MLTFKSSDTQEEVLTETLTETGESHSIILYNDEVNTFDFVIHCLIKYCDQDMIQAEQCTWIVHHNGKCDVKSGDKDELKPICEALQEKGLSATIE